MAKIGSGEGLGATPGMKERFLQGNVTANDKFVQLTFADFSLIVVMLRQLAFVLQTLLSLALRHCHGILTQQVVGQALHPKQK